MRLEPAGRFPPSADPAGRRRSAGVLDPDALAICRAEGVALGYDPLQMGWVPLSWEDDVDADPEAPSAAARLAGPEARVAFRPWREADADAFAALLDDPAVWRWLPEPYPAPLTPELARALIVIARTAEHHEALAVTCDGAPVGQVRLAFRPGAAARAEGEISYWFGRAVWGRGLGTAAVARYTARCFAERPELRAIVARVHGENRASARLLARCGYVCEGPAADDPAILVHRIRRP